MKHKQSIIGDVKTKFFLFLILLSGLINSQPVAATDFTNYPEDSVTEGTATIFKNIDTNLEKLYGAFYFGSGSDILKDARSGLAFSPKNNVKL